MATQSNPAKPSRVIELGSAGNVHHTITVRPLMGYFSDPGTANSLTGGLPTRGQWKELGVWTVEIQHASGAMIWSASSPYNEVRLQEEIARGLTLLAGWRILSDSAGVLTIGDRAS